MTDPLYLDDLQPCQVFVSDNVTVDADMIRRFAAEYDPQPFHLDDAAAQGTLFRGLAASGWHTAALTMRLLVDGGLPLAGGIVGAGMDDLRWPTPTRPGDVLRVRSEVVEVRPSQSRLDRGLAKVRITTLNTHDEVVQTATANLVVPRRPGTAATESVVTAATNARHHPATEAWLATLHRYRVPTRLGQINVWLGGKPDGPAMVFWPSLLVDSSMWRYQYEHYAATHRLAMIDPPGAGKSEALQRTFDLAECCDCVTAVLDALEIDRCTLVGTSWGALVGSVFAALHPERLHSAVLINGSATPPSAHEIGQMTELVTALEGMDTMPDWVVGATQSAFAGPTAETSKPEFMDYLRCVLDEDPRSVAFAIRSVVIGSTDRHALLRTVKDAAVLVLAGEEDRRFPVEEARAMADAIPESQFVVVPRTGHLAARESPDAVNQAVDAFLEGITSRPPRVP